MKWRVFAYILLAVLALSACQSSSSPADAPSTAGTSAKNFEYVFVPAAETISVQVSLDSDQSAEAVIPVEGGSLMAAAADGTTYTLEIPADALLNETTIRMTPAASVSGMPFGGEQTYAVQLEPEGLFFNNYATLTITPGQELPIDQQILFGYEGDGQNLALALPVVDSREIKLRVLHFSGYGVTKGLLADIEPVRQRLGGDAEARLQSVVAEVLSRERQRQLLGQESETDLGEFFNDIFQQFQEQVINPRVAAAGESCAAGRLALQTVLSFERQRQLLGMGDEGSLSEYGDLMNTVTHVCVQEEYELCTEEHIIHRMIPVWLGLERQNQLLGLASETTSTPELEEAKNLTQKCLTFELAFESDGNFDDGEGGGYESVVKAKVPLKFDPAAFKIKGESALVNELFEFKAPGCRVTSNRGGSTFDGISLEYIADTHSPTDELGYVRDYSLIYWPETTTENFSITCDDSPTYNSPPTGFWSGLYLVLHFDEINSGGQSGSSTPPMPDISSMFGGMGFGAPAFPMPQMGEGEGYLATNWELQSGDYLAKKEWIKEDASLGLIESGTLKLYHRPGN